MLCFWRSVPLFLRFFFRSSDLLLSFSSCFLLLILLYLGIRYLSTHFSKYFQIISLFFQNCICFTFFDNLRHIFCHFLPLQKNDHSSLLPKGNVSLWSFIFILSCVNYKYCTSILQLSNYKNIVNCLDGTIKVLICHTNDDIKLGRTLIDHLYIDIAVSQCREDSACSTTG